MLGDYWNDMCKEPEPPPFPRVFGTSVGESFPVFGRYFSMLEFACAWERAWGGVHACASLLECSSAWLVGMRCLLCIRIRHRSFCCSMGCLQQFWGFGAAVLFVRIRVFGEMSRNFGSPYNFDRVCVCVCAGQSRGGWQAQVREYL